MEERGHVTIFGIAITFLIIITLTHSIAHLTLFGTGIKGVGEKGISGLVIGETKQNELETTLQQNHPGLSPLSRGVLMGEWVLLIIAVIASLAIEKMHAKKENVTISMKTIARGKSKTDLDTLYDLLKEKKKLKLSTIATLFHVTEETATDWAKILESGNLAAINYPRIGEPELVII